MADSRLTPARSDLAASFLKGEVEALRFVDGEKAQLDCPRAWLRATPSQVAAQTSELLLGEAVTVYERKAGWAWVQVQADSYIGYMREAALGPPATTDARVVLPLAPILAGPDVKAPLKGLLPLNALVKKADEEGDFVRAAGGFVPRRALAPKAQAAADFVSVAEAFLGAPYVWGGKTSLGVDCSGLIQTALQAANVAAPRDTDMMERQLGRPIRREEIRRGDLVFWKGHMGVMADERTLLHANAFFMAVTREPLADAMARISTPPAAIKRL
ncbi:MAG: C40 family peptidase [Rhizomicrobium sp.]